MSLWIAETWLRKSSFTYSLSFGEEGELTGTADERLLGGEEDLDTADALQTRADERDSDRIWGSLGLGGFTRH